MWYHRFVSWIRSLFTVPSHEQQAPEPYTLPDTGLTALPWTGPLRGPRPASDTNPQLPPLFEFPPQREPPTTVPLARLARPSQPLTDFPLRGGVTGPITNPARAGWDTREAAPPSQPLRASQPSRPIPEPLPADEPIWSDPITEPDFLAPDGDNQDDQPPTIEPGSELYRRLVALRRLVRLRVYNEGFPPDATPDQYKTYGGGESDDPFSNPFDE